ncbi:MAG: putative rane protein [Phycisphaerales bacterium]|nr:putative rane protein [Phycisphaerales bacterium]
MTDLLVTHLLAAAATGPVHSVGGVTKDMLAALNATLNGTSAVLLLVAFVLIKRRRVRAHAWTMVAALCTSAVFLVFYVTSYVLFKDRSSGLRPGPLRTFYFALLISHVLLAVGMLPMIFLTFQRAYRRQWQRHRAIARPTFYIWFYVSVTGVIVYWMLYHLFPSLDR